MRVLVIGLGRSGSAVARFCAARGDGVVVIDDRPSVLDIEGATVLTGPDVPDAGGLLAGVDLVVPSPGVPPTHSVLVHAAREGVDVWSEIELASRETARPIIAVTGTNGKTTVSTLIHRLLRDGGSASLLCGNVGTPFVEALDRDNPDAVYVVEVSSFQLAFTHTLRPRVGVWLNFAPDHLDWHGTTDAYAHAKAKLWVNQSGTANLAVGNSDDPIVMAQLDQARGRRATFSGTHPVDAGVGVDDGSLVARGTDGFDVGLLAGADVFDGWATFEVANAAAAATAAIEMGVSPLSVAAVLAGFERLPHRRQVVAASGGVRWVDDSKATNPHAAVAAIESYPRVVLIAGGLAKDLDLSPLAATAERVRAVVAMGAAADEIEAVFFGAGVPVQRAEWVEDAVKTAATLARPGDVVLLAPACASQDQYHDYAERGDRFAAAARVMAAKIEDTQEGST